MAFGQLREIFHEFFMNFQWIVAGKYLTESGRVVTGNSVSVHIWRWAGQMTWLIDFGKSTQLKFQFIKSNSDL